MSHACDDERQKLTTFEGEPLDMTEIRSRLGRATGREYWRSLEELAGTPRFEAWLHREFPARASEWTDPVGRREFLRLMGASLALAGAGACTKQPPEAIVPYVRQPEEIVPGKPRFFATAASLGGVGTGILVESHMGRPTKVEGNPDHPASLGATDVFAQASLLTLYDPDRSQTLTNLGEIRPWSAFLGTARAAIAAKQGRGGEGFRILTEHITSPTLGRQLADLIQKYPAVKWHQYEPTMLGSAYAGTRLAFGRPYDTKYDIARAQIILALDDDLFGVGGGKLKYAREFARQRRVTPQTTTMNRLFVVESTPSITGAQADHRLPLRSIDIPQFAVALAARLGIGRAGPSPTADGGVRAKFLDAVAGDLTAHKGECLIVAGAGQPAAVHALVARMNQALGNIGRTVSFIDPIAVQPIDHMESLGELVRDMDQGRVDLLLIMGGNPVYTAPADLRFGERLAKVALRVHLGLYDDETSAQCHWHIPEAHPLESWGDIRAFDGTVTIVQPLIAPLYGGRSAHEVIAAFSDRPERSAYDTVRAYWSNEFRPQASAGGASGTQAGIAEDAAFERFWRKTLHDGFVEGTAHQARDVTVSPDIQEAVAALRGPTASPQDLELVFKPDPTIFDGRFANNGWLQELPKPLTKITWDNAALVSPGTAERLGLRNEERVRLTVDGRWIDAPIWIAPGHATNSITVHLGYGRTRAGRAGTRAGFDANVLRASAAPWCHLSVDLKKLNDRYPLATTQVFHTMEGRHFVRAAALEEYKRHPGFAQELVEEPPKTLTLYPLHEYKGYAWGMAIDVNSCTGCNACVVACQAENNIPVVGKEQVARAREMHWLRVDSYHRGSVDNPEVFHQPVPCMHCENAPCEVVCPVAATVHSDEGLNDMVYNRCVGTRYCSNNCPYKVRRFNFLLYQDWTTPSLRLLRNPDVSVRSRGVMEKCTYCVQRINAAKIDAEKEDRTVRDGEIKTACEAVCPTEAIVFGNINDPNSRVARLKASERNYALLAELNTRPRTTYLAAVRNPSLSLHSDGAEPREGD